MVNLADWQKNNDGTYTYFGHGHCITDMRMKAIITELMVGVTLRAVAKERKLPVRVVQEIYDFFNKLANE